MVKLEITLDPATGQINCNGPLGDKVLCWGLLQAAVDIVRAYEAPSSGIVAPPPGVRFPKLHGN